MYKVIISETFQKEIESLRNKNLEQDIYKKLKTLEAEPINILMLAMS